MSGLILVGLRAGSHGEKFKAWRERGRVRDSVWCRLRLLQGGTGADFLVSEINMNTEKGGVLFFDTDKQMRIAAASASLTLGPRSSGDYAGLSPPVSSWHAQLLWTIVLWRVGVSGKG